MNYYKLFIYSIFNTFYKDGAEQDSLYWMRPLTVITLICMFLTFSIVAHYFFTDLISNTRAPLILIG